MKKQNELSKSEMKNILGGVTPPAKACTVSCNPGYYACCNGGGDVEASCKCEANDSGTTCSSGGTGSTGCSIS